MDAHILHNVVVETGSDGTELSKKPFLVDIDSTIPVYLYVFMRKILVGFHIPVRGGIFDAMDGQKRRNACLEGDRANYEKELSFWSGVKFALWHAWHFSRGLTIYLSKSVFHLGGEGGEL